MLTVLRTARMTMAAARASRPAAVVQGAVRQMEVGVQIFAACKHTVCMTQLRPLRGFTWCVSQVLVLVVLTVCLALTAGGFIHEYDASIAYQWPCRADA